MSAGNAAADIQWVTGLRGGADRQHVIRWTPAVLEAQQEAARRTLLRPKRKAASRYLAFLDDMPTTDHDIIKRAMGRAASDFFEADTDGDEMLDFEEYCKLIRSKMGASRDPAELSDGVLRNWFDSIDVDGDGTVTMAEFFGHSLRAAMGQADGAEGLLKHLADWDADGGGVFDRHSFVALARRIGFTEGPQLGYETAAVELIQLLDPRGSGAVDFRVLHTIFESILSRSADNVSPSVRGLVQALSRKCDSKDFSEAVLSGASHFSQAELKVVDSEGDRAMSELRAWLAEHAKAIIKLLRTWDHVETSLVSDKELRSAARCLEYQVPSELARRLVFAIIGDLELDDSAELQLAGSIPFGDLAQWLRRQAKHHLAITSAAGEKSVGEARKGAHLTVLMSFRIVLYLSRHGVIKPSRGVTPSPQSASGACGSAAGRSTSGPRADRAASARLASAFAAPRSPAAAPPSNASQPPRRSSTGRGVAEAEAVVESEALVQTTPRSELVAAGEDDEGDGDGARHDDGARHGEGGAGGAMSGPEPLLVAIKRLVASTPMLQETPPADLPKMVDIGRQGPWRRVHPSFTRPGGAAGVPHAQAARPSTVHSFSRPPSTPQPTPHTSAPSLPRDSLQSLRRSASASAFGASAATSRGAGGGSLRSGSSPRRICNRTCCRSAAASRIKGTTSGWGASCSPPLGSRGYGRGSHETRSPHRKTTRLKTLQGAYCSHGNAPCRGAWPPL